MLASLQNVLPSSVLSPFSNNTSPKNQPQEDADDTHDRDNQPSPSFNGRGMADEQGVKKKKGRSNEVSLSFSVLVCAEAPQPFSFPSSSTRSLLPYGD